MRILVLVSVIAGLLAGQGTDPKPKASDYPVHKQIGDLGIGAEYMVRSISGKETSFTTDDYLVVEVALFPPRTGTIVRAREWTLRINGRKDELLTQPPGMVAASIKYQDVNRRGRLIVGAGPVVLGAPQPVERFPGDPRGRVPTGPRAPTAPADTGVEQEAFDLNDFLQRVSLLEGQINRPISGYLFFPYDGKLTKIKSVELIWRPETSEPLILKLR